MALMGNACVVIEGLFLGVPIAVIIGFDVLLEGVVTLKDMDCTGFLDQSTACCCFQS